MKKILILLITSVISFSAYSRPQYSILQTYGTKCNACHENTQGGGLRSAAGFLSRKDITALNPSWVGLKGFFDMLSSNTLLDDKVMYGLDFRYQRAKWPKGGGKTEEKFMVMQLTPYLAIKPFDFLEFEGYYNAAYDIESDMRYPGQQRAGGSMYIKPSEELPTLRVGYFQPTIGQKWDDHTMLIRQAPGKNSRIPVIPDDYQEWGAQIDYESIPWLGLSAGIFTSNNMASTYPVQVRNYTEINGIKKAEYTKKTVVDSGSIATALRATINPELPMGLTAYAGGTFYLNNDYYISSIFASFGMADKFSICAEYIRSEKKDSRLTLGYLVDLTYQVTDAILPFVRLERSVVKEVNETGLPAFTNQYIFGAHINLLPGIDLLPEYRIYDRESVNSYQTQWAIQLHVFY